MLPDNLVEKVEFGDCWKWTAATSTSGYGRFAYRGFQHQAHRLVYSLLIGVDIEGMDLDHLCRNRKCVNPDHLQPVSRQVNLLRGATIVAENATKFRCNSGHAYTEENTYRRPDGKGRDCRACRKSVDMRRRARRAQEV